MRKIDHKSKYLLEEYRKAKELYLYYFKKNNDNHLETLRDLERNGCDYRYFKKSI